MAAALASFSAGGLRFSLAQRKRPDSALRIDVRLRLFEAGGDDCRVPIAKGQRFGLHNFRHRLSTFLVNTKIQAKTVQGLLRHANVKTTLNLYISAGVRGSEIRKTEVGTSRIRT
jgi:integrase